MSCPLTESEVVRELANDILQRLVRATIRGLRTLPAGLSGDDSGLKNVWDEICVQVQTSQSIHWEDYERTVWDLASGYVSKLKDIEKAALWLQTSEGEDWQLDDWEDRDPNAAIDDREIIQMVVDQLYADADDFTSDRVRKYVENTYEL
jgi:hypothetical protein